MLPRGVGLAQLRVGMEQEHEAEAVESGKVNSWRWQPGARLKVFGISYSNLIFTTCSDSEICSLLPRMMDMQEMVFPLTYTVTMFHVLQQLSLLPFFLLCFVYDARDSFPLSWQTTLSRLLIPLISLLSILAGFEAWAGLSTSVTHKLERCLSLVQAMPPHAQCLMKHSTVSSSSGL